MAFLNSFIPAQTQLTRVGSIQRVFERKVTLLKGPTLLSYTDYNELYNCNVPTSVFCFAEFWEKQEALKAAALATTTTYRPTTQKTGQYFCVGQFSV